MAAELRLSVRRSARCALLGTPSPAVRDVWIVCHGYAQLADRFVRRFTPIATPARLIVAPEALNRFYLAGAAKGPGADAAVGATWMTREDRLAEIDDYVAYLDAVHAQVFTELQIHGAAGGVRCIALGFSQGAATVSRWAARTRARVERIVLWAGMLPPELEPAPDVFGGALLTLVSGTRDPHLAEPLRRAHESRLAEAKLPFESRTYDGGHDLDAAALVRLAQDFDREAAP
jgi:predicted esterase